MNENTPLNLEILDDLMRRAPTLDDAIHDTIDFFLDPDEFDDIAIYDEYAEMLYQLILPYANNIRN